MVYYTILIYQTIYIIELNYGWFEEFDTSTEF